MRRSVGDKEILVGQKCLPERDIPFSFFPVLMPIAECLIASNLTLRGLRNKLCTYIYLHLYLYLYIQATYFTHHNNTHVVYSNYIIDIGIRLIQ